MVRAGISGGPQSKWFWLQYYSLGSLKGPRKTKGAQWTSGGLSAWSNCKLSTEVNTNIRWEEEVHFIIIRWPSARIPWCKKYQLHTGQHPQTPSPLLPSETEFDCKYYSLCQHITLTFIIKIQCKNKIRRNCHNMVTSRLASTFWFYTSAT